MKFLPTYYLLVHHAYYVIQAAAAPPQVQFTSSVLDDEEPSTSNFATKQIRTIIPEQPSSLRLLTAADSAAASPYPGYPGYLGDPTNAKGEYVNVNPGRRVSPPLRQKLLVISFDGFRNLYLTNNRFLPWFNYFRSQGVYSDLVHSIFPSETFPNHYAIVTGRYAESHGIVANDMYDPATGAHFTMESTELEWWNQTEPIWITARRQGVKTAVSFWPGSAAVWQPGNLTADYYRPVYDPNVPYQTRIDEVVNHLAKDDVTLGLLYYNRPDVEGHYNGVESQQVATTLQQLDWYLSYILESTKRVGLGSDVLNIVICADHGMANITTQLYLTDYVDVNLIAQVPSYGAVSNILTKPGQLEPVYNALQKGASSSGLFRVYKKLDVPAEFHYSNNDRIGDLVLICEVGVYMSPNITGKYKKTASHGYDPKFAVMQPIFMARGPAFKQGGYKASKQFRTKDIYAIMTHVTGIEPFPNNATFEDIEDIFAENFPNSAPHLPINNGAILAGYSLLALFSQLRF